MEEVKYNLTYGEALLALSYTTAIGRRRWNAKGMYAVRVPGEIIATALTINNERLPVQDFMLLRTAQGTWSVWHASVSDTLAHDWCVFTLDKLYVHAVQRVQQELDELDRKRTRLLATVEDPPPFIPAEQLPLLSQQLEHMNRYAGVLEDRLVLMRRADEKHNAE